MNERHKCLLCLGSNVDGIHHLKNAEQTLTVRPDTVGNHHRD